MRMDFGCCFAYKVCDALGGKLSEGEQNGQEEVEEVEEAPGDQAAVDAVRQTVRQEVGPSPMARSAPLNGGCCGKSVLYWQVGPLPERQRPILVFAAVRSLQEHPVSALSPS